MKILKNITLVGLIILLSVFNYVWADKYNEEDSLLRAFKVTDAKPLELNITASGEISSRYMKIGEMEKISKDLIKELNILGTKINENQLWEFNPNKNNINYHEEIVESKEGIQLIVWGKDKDNRAITFIISSYKYGENGEETDLAIDIVQNTNFDSLKETYDKIHGIFRKFNNITTKITTCITGTYDGKLKEKEKIEILTKALHTADGLKIEGIIEPSIISVSAYSPKINDYIYTGNKKMNLNIAIRYNEYENKTYLWMATPIITKSY